MDLMPEVNFGFGEKFPIGGGAGPLLGQRDWFLRITSYRGGFLLTVLVLGS